MHYQRWKTHIWEDLVIRIAWATPYTFLSKGRNKVHLAVIEFKRQMLRVLFAASHMWLGDKAGQSKHWAIVTRAVCPLETFQWSVDLLAQLSVRIDDGANWHLLSAANHLRQYLVCLYATMMQLLLQPSHSCHLLQLGLSVRLDPET